MEYLLVIAVLAGLAYMIVRAGRSRVDPDSSTLSATDYRVSRTPPDPNDDFYWLSNDILKANATFIEERWNRALKGQEAGTLIDSKEFPNWYFDEPTEPQMNRLRRMGLVLRGRKATKGQASDLIGLGEEPSQDELAILRFFSMATRDMNETRARADIASLMADPENVKRWTTRPATALQRECIRLFGEKAARELTAVEAERVVAELAERNPGRDEEWGQLQDIIDQFNDRDYREMVSIKRPSAKALREAIEQLCAEGATLRELSDDPDVVAERLIQMLPDLEHHYDA